MTSLRLWARWIAPALAMVGVLAGAGVVAAQAAGGQTADGKQTVAMMGDHQAKMASMQASDQALEALIARFDAARGGDAKIAALGEVVKQLASERRAMREQMMDMQGRMRAQQDHAAATPGTPGMNCPMMKDAKPEAEPDHTQHPPAP